MVSPEVLQKFFKIFSWNPWRVFFSRIAFKEHKNCFKNYFKNFSRDLYPRISPELSQDILLRIPLEVSLGVIVSIFSRILKKILPAVFFRFFFLDSCKKNRYLFMCPSRVSFCEISVESFAKFPQKFIFRLLHTLLQRFQQEYVQLINTSEFVRVLFQNVIHLHFSRTPKITSQDIPKKNPKIPHEIII